MATTTFLKLDNVSRSYEAVLNGPPLTVLNGITFELAQGDSMAVVGPSGCGKSTLLNIIGTLDEPSSGEVWFEGRNLAGLNEKEIAEIRNRRIGFVFQSHHLLPQCTILENVLVPTLALSRSEKSARHEEQERAHKLLNRVGLGSRTDHRPGQLSGGERQRAAVVRALINQPKLILADEPTGALDRRSSEELSRLLVELNAEEGTTLIVVTHALDLARQMKRVCPLKDGRLEPIPKPDA